jgi:hypothetical protein
MEVADSIGPRTSNREFFEFLARHPDADSSRTLVKCYLGFVDSWNAGQTWAEGRIIEFLTNAAAT